MIEPLHIATVGGQPLRFFHTPLDDGRPDLPWVAIDDLGRCLGLNRARRRIHLRVFYEIRAMKEIVRTIATANGPVSIAPHALAKPVLEALIDTGRARTSANVRDEYTNAVAEASMKLTPGPFPSPEAATAWANAAASRWFPLEKPIPVAELFPKESGAAADEAEPEVEYLLTEGQALYLTMCAAGDQEHDARGAKDICHDMVKVIMAWRRGKLLPKWEVPKLAELCKDFETPDWPPKS